MPTRPVATPVQVGQSFLELHHQLHRTIDHAMGCAGISLARAKVLMRLEEHGPMNQARLAGLLGFAPRSVTETVDALEREGLVSRREDEKDRRARIVAVTAAGREALATAMAIRDQWMEQTFGRLTAADRAKLTALLASIRANLQAGESCSDQ